MDAAIRRTIARIDVINHGRTVQRGTGTLVGPRLVLTALHVVAERHTNPLAPHPGEIRLTFPGHTTEAVIFRDCYDAQSDWVLLECADPPRIRPMPLGDVDGSGLPFETFGFPDIQPVDGMVQRGTIEDHRAELLGASVFQLFSLQAAAGDGAPLQGCSGSPVLVENSLVGVLRAALMNERQTTRAGTLYACPLEPILDHCGDWLPVPDSCRGLPGLRRRPLPPRPFTFLNRFTAADAEIFCGRSREIRQLYDRLTSEDAAQIVLLYGQAGVGKSSFLEAGILPRLEWTHNVRYARTERHERLVETVLRTARGEGGAERTTDRPLVLILDQLEEIYTQGEEGRSGELKELISAIGPLLRAGTVGPQSRIVLGFRKEWFPEVQKELDDAHLSYGKVFLDRLTRESVIEIVRGLTVTRRLRERYGLTVEPRLPDMIADDLKEDRDSAIAPTLRILLSKMWEQATERNRAAPSFTVESYQDLKRDGVLLGDFLDQQIERIGRERAADLASGLIIDVLAFHTSPLLTSHQRSADELSERYRHRNRDLPVLLQEMKRHLLLVDPAGDVQTHARATRLSHDTLAPLVRRRFDESDRPGQRARRILESRVVDWRDGATGAPLDGADLDAVERGLTGMRAPDESEARLLDASRQRRAREQRLRHLFRGASAAAVVIIVALAGFYWQSAQRAEREARYAVSAARTVQAREALESDPALAAQIIAELSGYPEASGGGRTAHLVLNERIPLAILRGHTAAIRTVAVSPDGQHVLTTSDDETARIWRLDGGSDPIKLEHVNKESSSPMAARSFVLGGVYDPDGRTIATSAVDRNIRLWTSDGTLKHTLPHERIVDSVKFSPDGALLLATLDRHDTVVIWDMRHVPGGPLYRLPHPATVASAEFAPVRDSSQVVTLAAGVVRIWTLRAGSPPVEQIIPVPESALASVATFSASNSTDLALGSRDGRVWLLSAAGQNKSPVLHPPPDSGPVQSIRRSPDGRLLAVTWSTTARLWDPPNDRLVTLDRPTEAPIRKAAFSHDGAFLATSADTRVWLWPLVPDIGPAIELRGHTQRVESLEFRRDGRFLVSGSSDGTARVWRTSAVEPELIARLATDDRVTFSPTGAYAASLSDNRSLKVWQIHHSGVAEASSVELTDAAIRHIQIDEAGTHVLAIGENGEMRVWKSAPAFHQLELILQRDGIVAATFGPGDSGLRTVDSQGGVRTWRIGSAWPAGTTFSLMPKAQSAVWSLDGTRVLTVLGNKAILVSAADGRQLAELECTQPIQAIALDSAGARAVTSTTAGTEIWNVASLRPGERQASVPLPRVGDTAASTTFNSDGSRVLIRDVLGTARVFRSDGTDLPIELTGERLSAASFDADGSHVLGVAAGKVLRWRVGWDQLIAALQDVTTTCLTPEQRMQFFAEAAERAREVNLTCTAARRARASEIHQVPSSWRQ